jgi:hypothetical protein
LIQGIAESSTEIPARSSSEPCIGGAGFLYNLSALGRAWATTTNLIESHPTPRVETKLRKRVRYETSVRVVLIPTRDEYVEAGLQNDLWWEDTDYTVFKNSAVRELKALMTLKRLTNSKEALTLLYQPGFHIEIEDISPTVVATPPPMKVSSDDAAPGALAIQQEEKVYASAPYTEGEAGSPDARDLAYMMVQSSLKKNGPIPRSISESALCDMVNAVKKDSQAQAASEEHKDKDQLGLLRARTDVELRHDPNYKHHNSHVSAPPVVHPLAHLAN